jgi:hypothetical protein
MIANGAFSGKLGRVVDDDVENHPVSGSRCHPSFVRRGACKKRPPKGGTPNLRGRLKAGLRTFCPEEILDELAAVVGEDAAGDLDTMVEVGGRADIEMRVDGAEAFVSGSVDEAFDAGVYEGTGTHNARLDRGVERRPVQAVIPGTLTCGAECEDLGMGRRVVIGDRAIGFGGEDRALG